MTLSDAGLETKVETEKRCPPGRRSQRPQFPLQAWSRRPEPAISVIRDWRENFRKPVIGMTAAG
jgi:hypothetical protein